MLYDSYAFFSAVDNKAHDCTVSKRFKIGHSILEGLLTMFWWAALGGVSTALGAWLKIEAEGGLTRRQDPTAPPPPADSSPLVVGPDGEFEWGRSKIVGSLALAGLVG